MTASAQFSYFLGHGWYSTNPFRKAVLTPATLLPMQVKFVVIKTGMF
jgi:hypothetical protein